MSDISILRTFGILIKSGIRYKKIHVNNIGFKYRKCFYNPDIIFGYGGDEGSYSYLLDTHVYDGILFIVSDNDMIKINLSILEDLETHDDLEIILKYGKRVSDSYLLGKVNKRLETNITIKDLDSFIETE